MLVRDDGKRAAIVAVGAVVLLLLGCPSGRKIQSQDDADLVIRSLWDQIRMTVHYGTPTTYANQTIAGSVSGHLVANGAIQHSSYYDGFWDWQVFTYNNMALDCSDFCTSNDFTRIHFTGDATLNGTINCHWSDYHYEYIYTGAWAFVGSGRLSGEFSGDVSFNITVVRCGNKFYGTINSGSKGWDVSWESDEY